MKQNVRSFLPKDGMPLLFDRQELCYEYAVDSLGDPADVDRLLEANSVTSAELFFAFLTWRGKAFRRSRLMKWKWFRDLSGSPSFFRFFVWRYSVV